MKRTPDRGEGKPLDDPAGDLSLSAGDRNALGELQSIHAAASRVHKINIAITSGFTIIFAGAALAFAIHALVSPTGQSAWGGAAVFGGLALLPGLGLVFLVRKLRWRLYLFENGFVFVRGNERVVLWTDIESITEEGLAIDRELRLSLQNGKQVKIDNSFQDFAAFSDAVGANVTGLVLARAATALPQGAGVSFGKLKLSQTGLEHEGKRLAWADVESISTESRVSGNLIYSALVVWKRSTGAKSSRAEWVAKRIGKFPNFDAFVQLASRFTKVEMSK